MAGTPENPQSDASIGGVKEQVGAIVGAYDERSNNTVKQVRDSIRDVAGRLAALRTLAEGAITELYALDDVASLSAARINEAQKDTSKTAAALGDIVSGSNQESLRTAPEAILTAAAPLEDARIGVYTEFDFMGAAAAAERLRSFLDTMLVSQAYGDDNMDSAGQAIHTTNEEIINAVNAT